MVDANTLSYNQSMPPLSKTHVAWSPQFAYAVGLLTTDGSLSKDGRHIDLTSKDTEQLENFLRCLGRKNRIGTKNNGQGQQALRVQFSDVVFYAFLAGIGLTPNKTKTIGKIKVPDEYFFDFLRGHFDGDGSFHSYFDPRWRSSFMFYTIFVSASKKHIDWLREEIRKRLGISGHITKSKTDSIYQLKFAKAESLQLIPKMYYDKQSVCLTRKKLKIERALRENLTNYADVAKLATASP